MEKGLLFTWGLTVLGGIGGVFNPFVGLCVYVCLAIVRPEYMWSWNTDISSVRYSKIVGLSLLLGWGLSSFGRWKFGRASSVVGCLLAYWGWMVVSALQAGDSEKAWDFVVFHAKVFLPFLVGITTIRTMAQVRALVWVILLSQGYVAFELNLQFYQRGLSLVEEGFGSMDNNSVAIAMVTGVGLAFFLGMSADRWWKQAIALGSALLMVHVILFSMSRGGMLALALTGLMSFILIPKKPRHYLLFLLAIAMAIRLAGPEVRKRFFTSFEKSEVGTMEVSAESRFHLWSAGLDKALKNPLFGVGPDNWTLHAPEYGLMSSKGEGKEVHSLWVQNAAELGFPGLALLLALFIVCMVKLWPLARGRVPVLDPWQQDVARMVIASLFGFIISAQFVTIKYLETPYYVLLAGAAVLQMLPQQPDWRTGKVGNSLRELPGTRSASAPHSTPRYS